MRANLSGAARTVGAPVLFGAVTVTLGTLGYLLFFPGVPWALSGESGRFPPFLITAAVTGGLFGAALGLCIAADRAARDSAGPVARPKAGRRRWAASERRLRRPPVRYGRERRMGGGRAGSPGHPACGTQP
jgi:hypothetical protein